MIGSIIKDTYRIDSYLGEGGPSIVYLGTDLVLDVPVAIKILKHNSLGDGSSTAERFLREARIQSGLVHQHIVAIRSIFSENDKFFIIMEFVNGGDLAQKLKEAPEHRLEINECTTIFEQVLLGLNYAHERNITHRDIILNESI